MKLLGKLSAVTSSTQLIHPADVDRIVEAAKRAEIPCTRAEATTLVAEIIAAYPGIKPDSNHPEKLRDFKAYSIKLFEAFSAYSYEIGKLATHGATGIPSINQYKPQPSDIVKFCESKLQPIRNASYMALKHREESRRRAEERARERTYDWAKSPENRRKIDDIWARAKNEILACAS